MFMCRVCSLKTNIILSSLIVFIIAETENKDTDETATKENKAPRYTKSQARQRYKKGKT